MPTKRKEDITRVAQGLFSSYGYVAVSMRQIAEAVGIETSSIYSHFEKKEDILWRIAIHCAEDFHQTVTPIAQCELHTKAKLQQMIVAHVDVTLRNREAANVFTGEWKHLEEPRRTEYAALRDSYEQMFRQVIAQGVAENLFRQIDEKFGALTILSALNWTYLWYKPEGELRPGQIGEALAEILLNGLVRNI